MAVSLTRSAHLKPHYILGSMALFPFHNFTFDFLVLLQGPKALALNVAGGRRRRAHFPKK